MEKGIKIQKLIIDKLFSIAQQNPAFMNSAKEISTLLIEMSKADLNINRKKIPEKETNKYLDKIVYIFKDNIALENISSVQSHDIIISIGEMRQADFDHLSKFFSKLSEDYASIANLAQEMIETLNHASGKTRYIEKPSLMQSVKNVFKIRNFSENDKEKLKL